jgi:Asp-tRNA(Asn)/Glu-tRNA(Gln) amidotransferase A subunit family amidase
MQRARDAEREIARGQYRDPLHGIPYTLKDVIATRGIRTTFGNLMGLEGLAERRG